MTWTRKHRRVLRRFARQRARAIGRIVVHLEADTTSYVTSMREVRRALDDIRLRERELRSRVLYQRCIDYERATGLEYVRQQAARVRAELGLVDQ